VDQTQPISRVHSLAGLLLVNAVQWELTLGLLLELLEKKSLFELRCKPGAARGNFLPWEKQQNLKKIILLIIIIIIIIIGSTGG
jgi:hypothetical protein